VHNLFLAHLSISTCYGRLCAHHQEKQLCFLRHLVLVIVRGWLSGMQEHMLLHTRQSSTHSRPKHAEIDKYTKNKLCNKFVLFTRLSRFVFTLIPNVGAALHPPPPSPGETALSINPLVRKDTQTHTSARTSGIPCIQNLGRITTGCGVTIRKCKI